jgi:hypothetical protein
MLPGKRLSGIFNQFYGLVWSCTLQVGPAAAIAGMQKTVLVSPALLRILT